MYRFYQTQSRLLSTQDASCRCMRAKEVEVRCFLSFSALPVVRCFTTISVLFLCVCFVLRLMFVFPLRPCAPRSFAFVTLLNKLYTIFFWLRLMLLIGFCVAAHAITFIYNSERKFIVRVFIQTYYSCVFMPFFTLCRTALASLMTKDFSAFLSANGKSAFCYKYCFHCKHFRISPTK